MEYNTGVETPVNATIEGIKGVQHNPFTRLARIDPTVRLFREDVLIL
jgi:hypothetical protein